MKSPSLALVVIGRNSEKQLSRIYTPEQKERLTKHIDEFVYVDSFSTDNSVLFMKSAGFRAYTLTNGTIPCASIGRRIGTEVCASDYILYLDSDMEIQDIPVFFEEIMAAIQKNNIDGCVGSVMDVYPDGGLRRRVRKVKNMRPASSFGGFVVLKRADVLSCGNWSSNLKANEELDLYVRLRAAGRRVVYLENIMVYHYTVVPSQFSELLRLYFSFNSGRYGALGKAAKNMNSFKSVFWFVLMNKEVFLFLPLILLFPFVDLTLFFMSCLLYCFLVFLHKGWKYLFVIPGLAISLSLGIFFPVNKNMVSYEEL